MNKAVRVLPIDPGPRFSSPADPVPFVSDLHGDTHRLNLMVDNIRCGGCMRKIETALNAVTGVTHARVNMSTRRLVIEWTGDTVDPRSLITLVCDLGFPAAPFDPSTVGERDAVEERRLLTATAVAGFAAANVMLLSVSVWAGYGGEMGTATRTLFHWISALIAIPAVAYAGRPFFHSAARALSKRQLNMDVPISLAIVLATAMSLYQSAIGGEHAYFDAALGLVFFLLIGRYLDQRARNKARSAAQHLIRLAGTSATVLRPNGMTERIAADHVRPGMMLQVSAGESLAADGRVVRGTSSLDCGLVTGESLPQTAEPGTVVHAGTINMDAPLQVEVTAAGDDTLLAEIVRLMEAAEQNRDRYVRIADRVARFYAPAVHILAALTLAGWLIIGNDVVSAMMAAVAVLIITCPCALGLAVPTVQVVATGLLMRRGVLVKSADGLERLADIDVAVFDKTGTLTLGAPTLVNAGALDPDDLAAAAALARTSRHPLCQAIAAAEHTGAKRTATDVHETSGRGLEGIVEDDVVNLGSAAWLGIDRDAGEFSDDDEPHSEIWMVRDDRPSVVFRFRDTVRPGAVETVVALRQMGILVRMMSGDREAIVRSFAKDIGIDDPETASECLPGDKVSRIRALTELGHKVLMVGDGLNDAPALAEGHASISPAAAADISRNAADIVFQGQSLQAVADSIRVARRARQTVKQNFGLAFAYNVVAVPLAMAGFATPLFAAIAMSASSLVVTLNSLRLNLIKTG